MNKVPIKLVETDSKFFERVGRVINLGSVTWINFPFWLKKISEDVYKIYSFDELPKELRLY